VSGDNEYNLANLSQMDKLYSRLQEVEDKIKEEDLRIKDMKAQVLKNDHTIKTMLGSIVRPANR
jgi:hypothetical protein